MSKLKALQIHESLRRLAKARPKIFGADVHGLKLNPPVSAAEVAAFEQRHEIVLPAEYKAFLTEVGNGGAGPFYGVLPLGYMDGLGHELEPWQAPGTIVGVLSEPFPHHQAWNDLAGMPQVEDLNDADDEELDRFEQQYWNGKWVNGAIPICHMGCALRVWLVVTGDQAGHLWRDGRAEYTGLSPISLRDGSPATFGIWYMEWLQECLKTALSR